jgi:uncharacterized protein HemX
MDKNIKDTNKIAIAMISLEQQVVSLELAKRLKELGVKQESLFWWYAPEDWHQTTQKKHKYFRKSVIKLHRFSCGYL